MTEVVRVYCVSSKLPACNKRARAYLKILNSVIARYEAIPISMAALYSLRLLRTSQ
jgi:hypothetical protein